MIGKLGSRIESMGKSRRLLVVLFHAVSAAGAYFLAYAVRFDFPLPEEQWILFYKTLPVLLIVRLTIFGWFHLYQGLWRYVSMKDIVAIVQAVTLSSVIFIPAALALVGYNIHRSVFVLDWLICLGIVGGARIGLRVLREMPQAREGRRRALVVGAGDAAESLIRSVLRDELPNYEIVGMVDDDLRLRHRRIHGIPVVGRTEDLPHVCSVVEAEEILVAIPSATQEEWRSIVERGRACGIPLKSVPSLRQLLDGRARIAQLQEVSPASLLQRDEIIVDVEGLRNQIGGRCVLVTGAAGSIGSELCRQIAAFEPATLLLLDQAESNLYMVHLELSERHPKLELIPTIADICDRRSVIEVFQQYRPTLVYHAAAYKHVPLMERHPVAAVANNVIGTEVVAEAAMETGVQKFVLISTDKAVRPVGIMGMTKRVAEDLLLALQPHTETSFVAVRFGNVLGSEGSVLPLFRWQMSTGGPITITHEDATRYFMLLSEAAQLVLEAGLLGTGGEVFFLDMGKPVRIYDLANDLIRLSGMHPGVDVGIETIGLRPGERLSEELVTSSESLTPTPHEKIHMLRKEGFDADGFKSDLEILKQALADNEAAKVASQLASMTAP